MRGTGVTEEVAENIVLYRRETAKKGAAGRRRRAVRRHPIRKREARGGEQFFTFVCRGERCLSGKKQSDNLPGRHLLHPLRVPECWTIGCLGYFTHSVSLASWNSILLIRHGLVSYGEGLICDF